MNNLNKQNNLNHMCHRLLSKQKNQNVKLVNHLEKRKLKNDTFFEIYFHFYNLLK